MNRRLFLSWRVLVPLGLLTSLGFVASVVWHVTTNHLEAGLERWVAEQRRAGWQVQAGPPHRGGWPFWPRVSVTQVELVGGGNLLPGGLRWRAERVDLQLDMLAPTTLQILPHGAQSLRLGQDADRLILARHARLAFPLARQTEQFSITLGLENAQIDGAVLASLELRLDLPIRSRTLGRFAARASGVVLPDGVSLQLGPYVTLAEFAATLTGPGLPPNPSQRDLILWRNGGGEVEITGARLQWGRLDAALAGKGTLDARLQPAAAATLRVVGHLEALEALAQAGLINRRALPAISAGWTLLARKSTPPWETELPLTLRDGTLAAGAVPLARHPPLSWPAP